MRALSLAELQSAFKRYLFAGDNEADLAALVASDGETPALTRLDVYRNAYYVRLEEALARDFPALRAVLGDEEFGRLMAAYLVSRPSTRFSLRFLGEGLVDWLRRTGHDGAWADIAALEWAVLQAFDAPDAASLRAEDLEGIAQDAWPDLRLALHPSVSLLAAHSNAREVWRAVRQSRTVPEIHAATEWLVLWRSCTGTRVEAVSQACYTLLSALAGGSFGMACETLSNTVDPYDVPALAAASVHLALARGWMSGAAREREQSP